MMRRLITLSFFLVCLINHALSQEITGKVVSVIDGNTIEFFSSDNETFKFILAGIDCPELNQDFGEEAKKHLEKILKGKQVSLIVEGRDRLGIKVGSILLANGEDPRIDLLKKGLAWTQEKSPNLEFESVKEAAKNKGLGLWKQENPIPPWIFRRQQSMLSPKMG